MRLGDDPCDDWEELRDEFRSIVFRDGVDEAADEMGVASRTIYRIIGGETRRPYSRVQRCIERLVERNRSIRDGSRLRS